MLSTLRQRKVARILFDEAHGEAWSIRPAVAAKLHPEHHARASYGNAADALAAADFAVAANLERPLTAEVLSHADVLVFVHPSDARWERTVDGASPLLTSDELDAVETFVERGGGLLVLGENEQDKYGDNMNDLLARFGIHIESTIAHDYTHFCATPTWVLGERAPDATERTVVHLVEQVCLARSGTLVTDDPGALVLRTSADADPAHAGLLATVTHGGGRVVALADADLFGDDHLGELDHRQLWMNLLYWVSAGAFRSEPETAASAAASDPAWVRLRDETNQLRRLQQPKGDVDLERHDLDVVRGHVEAMAESITALAPRFPHERAYLEQAGVDLRAWLAGGCGKPDFTASLALFRPEQHRRDGLEHLVVFPMYTPNGSPDVRFEALITRTPWPEFVARLESELYDNEKFVPVQLVDFTDGYDSECAVLFPETVSVATRPTNNFGGIFCDREAARFQRAVATGAAALGIDLPPDAAALISSGDLSRETYILWDMIHDRWHSHGDLPFDPFMIRQRLPYWMYSLEELRVDLATFVDAGRIASEGFPFARYVQYAIVFDRILRFPITGNRVRNYDGLGGQLLFGFLHQAGALRWTDNRLLIDWRSLGGAVTALHERIDELYRRGIDMSKVSYWAAAHDLIAEFVPANVSSQWLRARRVYSDEADTRAWIDRVLNDEFPLSTFYLSLQKKTEAAEAVLAA